MTQDVSRPVLEQLQSELSAASVSGRAVFLRLHTDNDSTVVVREMLRRARAMNRRLEIAVASAADPATPAWRQIAFRLTGRHRAGTALKRSIVEWLGVVPLVGPLIGAIANTIAEVTNRPALRNAALGTGSSLDDVRRILAHGRLSRRLIVLEDVEDADAAELSGAFALLQQIRETRTLLVLIASCDDSSRVKGFTDLLWEAERLGAGRLLSIDGSLAPAQIDLLRCAAAIGSEFALNDLARALGQDEDHVERQLGALTRSGLLRLRDTVETAGELVDVYEFADPSVAARWTNGPADSRRDRGSAL